MEITEIVTLFIACLGAVLGVINTINNIRKDKVKVKIIPAWEMSIKGTYATLTVINLSQFPIIIDNFGFKVSRTKTLYVMDCMTNGKQNNGYFPQEISPRNNVKITVPLLTIAHDNFRLVKKAMVSLADGRKFYGTSPALKQMIKLNDLPIGLQNEINKIKKLGNENGGFPLSRE